MDAINAATTLFQSASYDDQLRVKVFVVVAGYLTLLCALLAGVS